MLEQNILLKSAENFCTRNGHKFTQPRQAVLQIIASTPNPIGAYAILEKLGQVIASPKPPTAYRAIDFWMKNRFIHKIESLNAYVLCQAHHPHSGAQFMVCDNCNTVIETHLCHLPEALQSYVGKHNFKTSYWNLELHGLCSDCQASPD